MLVIAMNHPLAAQVMHNVSVSISGGAFNPANVTIHPGDNVTWINQDTSDHDLVAADNSFRSGNLKPGQSFTFTFKSVGQVFYSCTLHPRERGVVNVVK